MTSSTQPPVAGAQSGTSRRTVTLGWRLRLALGVGGWCLRLLGWSWRLRVEGHEWLRHRPSGHDRVVFTLWHGQMLPILWAHEPRTGVVVSEHRDGELISRLLEQFRMFAVRGSSSKGGARALLETVRVLRETGADMAFTPDGPRGPRHHVAPGALLAAHRAGVAIVPITAWADRAWRLRSWDQFEIPKPFARVVVRYGSPEPVRAADARQAAMLTDALSVRMNEELQRTADWGRTGRRAP